MDDRLYGMERQAALMQQQQGAAGRPLELAVKIDVFSMFSVLSKKY